MEGDSAVSDDGCDAEGTIEQHVDLLQTHHMTLLRELETPIFLNMLDPFLKNEIDDRMTKEQQTRKLLLRLHRAPKEKFNSFCEIIAGLHPELFELLQNRQPTRQELDVFFRPFYTQLCEGIISAGNITDNTIDHTIDLDTQFVTLKLTEKCDDDTYIQSNEDKHYESCDTDEEYDQCQGFSGKSTSEYQGDLNITELIPENFAGKSLMLIGKAGVGKSTLIQYLTRQWAKKLWGTFYSAVFVLNLRKLVHIKEDVTLSELLGMYAEYVIETPGTEKPPINWLNHNAERVLIFADGIDELPELGKLLKRTPKLTAGHLKSTPLNWCINLIQRNLLQKCTMVIISRPFIGLRELRYEKKIEVLGLSTENIMQFIELNVQSGRQKQVKEVLAKNPLLLSVCSVTFYCAAMCKVLEMDTSFDSYSLTTYTRITAYIITKSASRNSAEECAFSVLPEELTGCLSELAALAYHGLLGSENDMTRLIFDQNDLNHVRFPPTKMKMAKQTGLLHYKEVKDRQSPQLQAQFVHLSIQELLAMTSLMAKEPTNVERFFDSSHGRYNMAKLFAFGLFLDKHNSHIAAIRRAVSADKNTNVVKGESCIEELLTCIFRKMCDQLASKKESWLDLAHIAHESQQNDLAKLLGAAIAQEGMFELNDRRFSLLDLKAIFFCLGQSQIYKLICMQILVDEVLANELQIYLENSKVVQSLEFSGVKITDEATKCLSGGLKSAEKLKFLTFGDYTMTDKGMQCISEGIKDTQSLEDLVFHYSEISDEGMKYISEAIQSSQSLKNLKLADVELTQTSMGHLCKGIASAKSLCLFHIKRCKFPDVGLESFSECISCRKSQLNLHLEHLVISEEGMAILAKGLQRATCLDTLRIENCRLGDTRAKYLSKGIKNAPNLTAVHFCHMKFDGNGYIFGALTKSESIRILKLQSCTFEEYALEHFAEGMASSKIAQLELTAPNYREADIELLCQGIANSSNLQHLKFRGLFKDDTAMHHIKKCIANSKHLVHLQFEIVYITAEGMRLLCQAISSSSSLRHLHFSGATSRKGDMSGASTRHGLNRIMTDTQGMRYLSKALTKTKLLNQLTLESLSFYDNELEVLSRGIASAKSLKHLVLCDNSFTKEGSKHLSDALHKNKTIEHVQWKDNSET